MVRRGWGGGGIQSVTAKWEIQELHSNLTLFSTRIMTLGTKSFHAGKDDNTGKHSRSMEVKDSSRGEQTVLSLEWIKSREEPPQQIPRFDLLNTYHAGYSRRVSSRKAIFTRFRVSFACVTVYENK